MSAAAQFESVTQVFGDFTAVDDIDMSIPAGKLTTLLGPSGCGKTTSLRMLAGYTRPTKGRILIDGTDVTRTAPEKRGLGMVFQSYALFPHMTVAENVAYGLKLRRTPRSERDARVAEALELVGLGHLAARKPRALSGGQQQRVALARAIAIRPRLLLLDEPLSNLDARLRVQMRSEIRRIQAETGLTVVLVTHDQDEALEMSDEMILMRSGRIMQQGSPADVFGAPRDRFVADFLGYENFLRIGGRLVTVRPEHLDVVPLGGQTAPFAIPGVVADVAYRGVDLIVTVLVRDDEGEVTLLSNVRADGAPHVAPGDDVVITAAESRLITIEN